MYIILWADIHKGAIEVTPEFASSVDEALKKINTQTWRTASLFKLGDEIQLELETVKVPQPPVVKRSYRVKEGK